MAMSCLTIDCRFERIKTALGDRSENKTSKGQCSWKNATLLLTKYFVSDRHWTEKIWDIRLFQVEFREADFQFRQAILNGRSFSPFEWSIFVQVNYPIHSLICIGWSTMLFPGEKGVFVNPVVTGSIASNLALDMIGQLFVGGQLSSICILYTRLKWSFWLIFVKASGMPFLWSA